MTDVLLVDNDAQRLADLSASLQGEGLTVQATESLADVHVTAVGCLVGNAHSVLETPAGVPVILLDYAGDARRAVAAMKAGAADYLIAPFALGDLMQAIRACQAPGSPAADRPLNMVGFSKPMVELFSRIAKAGPADSAVLIEGESGTGKELVARALHASSARNQTPMISLNCATTPEQLIEFELFGYPESAANPARSGLLQAAHAGTLFLDGIEELPANVQARLLHTLRQGSVRNLDTGAEHRVDVRLIAATHRNLRQLIDNGLFREDLFYQINVVTLPIPPLRERAEDVIHIAELFLEQTSKRLARTCDGLSDSAKQVMLAYDWPGNVRELENAIERAVILCNDGEVDETLLAIDVNYPVAEATGGATDQTSLEDYFVSFVTAHQDQLTETELAKKLGISRKSLWERRQRLNIPRKRTRKRGPRRDSS